MKILLFLALIVSACLAAEENCIDDVNSGCKFGGTKFTNCNAKYGAIDTILPHLSSYANKYITHNWQYLMMSTHFGNYEKNRVGFEKLFRGLSDQAWDSAIDLIKYVTKRGGAVDFEAKLTEDQTQKNSTYELYEIESLAQALDIEKSLTKQAMFIHREVTRRREDHHDAEMSSFIEKEFLHKQRDNIRALSGHANDLKGLISSVEGNKQSSSLAVFLFDEYLQKL